jgi:hypothetical protein
MMGKWNRTRKGSLERDGQEKRKGWVKGTFYSKYFNSAVFLKALTDHLGRGSRVGSFDPY